MVSRNGTYFNNLYDLNMKIHTCVRDAKLMDLAELQAVDTRAKTLQANIVDDESGLSEAKEKEEVETPKKSRKKKKEEDV